MSDELKLKIKAVLGIDEKDSQYSKIESACLAVSHDDNAVDKRLDCIKECKKGAIRSFFSDSKLDKAKFGEVLEAFDKKPERWDEPKNKHDKLLNRAYMAGQVGRAEDRVLEAMGDAQKPPVSIGHYQVLPQQQTQQQPQQTQQQAASGVVYGQLPNMGGVVAHTGPSVQYEQLPPAPRALQYESLPAEPTEPSVQEEQLRTRHNLQYQELPPEPTGQNLQYQPLPPESTAQSIQYETLPPNKGTQQYGSVSKVQSDIHTLPDFSGSGVSPDPTPSSAKTGPKAPSRF